MTTALAAALWLAIAQAPQEIPPEPVAASTPPDAAACPLADAPVVEITGRVRARSLKFKQAGDTEVRIYAEPGGEGEWKLDRGPLPDPIPVGKTFRNIDVTLDAAADLDADGVTVRAEAAPTGETPTCN